MRGPNCHECGALRVGRNAKRTYYCAPCGRLVNKRQLAAQSIVQAAIKRGDLVSLLAVPTPCVDCGERAQGYDHRNYDEPLAVDPVCRKCNHKRGPATAGRLIDKA